MLQASDAISRFRRDLQVSALVRVSLMLAAVACVIVGPAFGINTGGTVVLFVVGAIWILLSYRSMRDTRLAADSPSLIAAGEFDRAETHIASALGSFSLFRTAKLLSLHHLALLRHAQHRWQEAAALCQALLAQRLGRLTGLTRTALMLMADSMLKLGNLPGAYQAIVRVQEYRLSLNESTSLLLLQLDYESRVGAWDHMLAGIAYKVQLCELMPSLNAARSQALLATAAYRTRRLALANWLRRRAELLADPLELIAEHPVLAESLSMAWT